MASTQSAYDAIVGEQSAVSDMPSPVSRPPQTCIFLDPTRMPREIRDMIYEEVIEQEYFRGRDWNCPGWRHWRGEIRTLHGGYVRYREHRDCLPAVAAVCKQIQEEFIERLYRKAKFYLTISMDYYHTNEWKQLMRNQPRLLAPDILIHVGNIRRLDLKIIAWQIDSYRYTAQSKSFLAAPFSIRYDDPEKTLSKAQLVRSDDSLAPTAYFDLAKYCFHGDSQLPDLLEAHKHGSFCTAHNSDFGRCFKTFLSRLGACGNLRFLSVMIWMDSLGTWEFTSDSGFQEFMRPFNYLRGLQEAHISIRSFEHHRPSSVFEDIDLFRVDAKRIQTTILSQRRENCSLDPYVVCKCNYCFPPLRTGSIDHDNPNMDIDQAELQINMQDRLLEVEAEKQRLLTPHDDEAGGFRSYWMYSPSFDNDRTTVFQVGLPEPRPWLECAEFWILWEPDREDFRWSFQTY
ncbi:uncharacterized protein BKA78DRAFT_363319 [Phyllosticta capitalensis]|uniref:uncharacterized protein n=1 Tax=Phyllosticta capitalensis TaxID=121624 RepID=UPI00312D978D